MKKLFIILAVFMGYAGVTHNALAVSWTYSRSITVTSTASVASGTLTNFPMLVSSTLASWKSSGAGGDIQNVVTAPNGSDEPADLVFSTSTANCTAGAYLNFETESYTSSTGALVDWVQVPSISTGTVIYACYDASGVSTNQSHPSSTWGSYYIGVWHMADNAATTTLYESTGNYTGGMQTVRNTSAMASSTGKMDGALAFNGTSDVATSSLGLSMSTNNLSSASYIFDIWMRPSNLDSNFHMALGDQGATMELRINNSNQLEQAGCTSWSDGSSASNNVFYQMAASMQFVHNSVTTTVYKNGSNVSTGNSASCGGTGEKFIIGGRQGSLFFTGNLDEVRIASGTIQSPSWFLTEYNNENCPDDSQGNCFYHVGAETAFGGGGGGGGIGEGAILFSILGAVLSGVTIW